jgi:hypothetical protein
VAVAVCIPPLLPFASTIMVAVPVPAALTTPPFSLPELGAALLFVVTGNRFGKEVSHVAVFVMSLTYGGVENVPMARNCPLPPKLPTVIELGITVTESRSCGVAVIVVVNVAEPETTLPSELVS